MKNTVKSLVVFATYTIVFILVNGMMPFSQEFKEASARTAAGLLDLLYVAISCLWFSSSICYTVSHTKWKGVKLALGVITVISLVHPVLTQVETLFFGSAFTVISKRDILLIMLAGILPLLASVPMAVKMWSKEKSRESVYISTINVKKLVISIVLVGFAYMIVYFVFGYFIAWKLEAVRMFYSGDSQDIGFWAKLIENWRENPAIYPFQFMRGVLFGIAALPLLYMGWNRRREFIISICLIYLSTAIVLIIPNFLFPDTVRWAHFIEMFLSMLLFGVMTGLIMSHASQRE
ncbi:hypothetical protein [Lacrimispora sp.]|uniref:hypothetical protein n=1 Tax=Lacrimispora sp. TaxID=2719234 RepID=UPI002864CD00|nr:hypothetical protein [Lacrimispora sp.]MDR7812714.1 hypothetical protein [Lacrimispora sp.]